MTRSLLAFAKATVSGLSFSLKDPSLLIPSSSSSATNICNTVVNPTCSMNTNSRNPNKNRSHPRENHKNISVHPECHENNRNVSFFDVINPATNAVIASVEDMGADRTNEAIELANEVFSSWRLTTGIHRSNLLLKWSELIKENKDDLAKIMTLESGKPLRESYGEIAYGTSYMDFYAAEAVRPTSANGGLLIPTPFADTSDGTMARGTAMVVRQGVGVCGIITPWNFPFGMFIRKVSPALAAGCTTVVKPSEYTPLTAIAVQNLSERAGIPKGAFEIITASKAEANNVGNEMCRNRIVRKISFTGSTAVGKLLMEQSSTNIKRVSLELGGNAAFIVFDDADINQAVTAAMSSKFRNAGQTCVCADRFIIHESVFDCFIEKFQNAVKDLVIGDGMSNDTTLGPLITQKAVSLVSEKVREAINDGAKVTIGGNSVQKNNGNFYEPTILTNVNKKSKIWSTETFGPVAACVTFTSEEEAIRLANKTTSGLAAYIMTRDSSRIFRVTDRLENGLIGVNEGVISSAFAPFGGIKESGIGREGASTGLDEYLEQKYIFINH